MPSAATLALPLLEPERLETLVNGLEGEDRITMLDELAVLYAEENARHLHGLRSAVLLEHWSQASRHAHYIKGSSANLGLRRLAASLAELEAALRRLQPVAVEEVDFLLQLFEDSLEAMHQTVQQWADEAGPPS